MASDEDREKFIRSYLSEEEITRLISEARKASKLASAPYSKFFVGACLLTFDGDYIFGCNIENISYTQTIHAEGCAISKAIADSKKSFKAVAVYAHSEHFDAFVPPCGECRQFLCEFANFLPIILVHETGQLMFEMLHELLPLSMVLGSSAPVKGSADNKYEQLVLKANGWILKDTHSKTRNEMRNLLRDWKFDEIHELVKDRLKFSDSGVLSGRFGAGPNSINYITVQELFEGLAQVSELGTGKVIVRVNSKDDYAVGLAHRIVATVNEYRKAYLVKEGQNVEAGSRILVDVSVSGEGEGKKYEIKVTDEKGAGISKDVVTKAHEEREKLPSTKFLIETYNHQKNRLLDETKFHL